MSASTGLQVVDEAGPRLARAEAGAGASVVAAAAAVAAVAAEDAAAAAEAAAPDVF